MSEQNTGSNTGTNTAEVVEGENLNDTSKDTIRLDHQEVTTPCPKCGHTTAIKRGTRNTAGVMGGAMHMIQFMCKSCSHVWNFGY